MRMFVDYCPWPARVRDLGVGRFTRYSTSDGHMDPIVVSYRGQPAMRYAWDPKRRLIVMQRHTNAPKATS